MEDVQTKAIVVHIHRHKSVCIYAYVSRLYAYVDFIYICIYMCIYLTTHSSVTDNSYHPLIIVLFVDRHSRATIYK